jgi:hypothetical protein
MNLQVALDIYNVFDKQTGYAIQPGIHSALYGKPTFFWQPRRLQLAARVQF